MSETTLLRSSAIVRNATIAPPQHGPVKTGELPLVQVRMTQVEPQVQESQQKAVTILPPKDAVAADKTGGLPMVNVKMTQNGPQLDDGQNNPVVIRNAAKLSGVSTGGLPMIDVKMTPTGPQIQTQTNIQGGPPQIPAEPPALSRPSGAPIVRQGYVARPAYPVGRQARMAPVARGATPTAAPQVQVQATPLPSVPSLTADQLMLCRHLVEKYLSEARASVDADVDVVGESFDVVVLAEATIATIDDALVATAARVEAAVRAAEAPAPATVAAPAATSISPAPSVAYTAGRVVSRSYVAGGARSQRNAGMAPRSTPRDGAPLPPVVVKMENQRPVVQTAPAASTEVTEVTEATVATEASAVESPADVDD
jgi:hypothetical protein